MLIEVDLWDNLYGLINGEHFKNLKQKPIQEKVEKYEYIKMKAFHSMKNITGQGNGWLVGHTVTAVVLAPIHVRASGFKFNFFPILDSFPSNHYMIFIPLLKYLPIWFMLLLTFALNFENPYRSHSAL